MATRNWLTLRLLPNDGKPNHQPELDGFRGLAVLFVLLAHSSHATNLV